ncbi:MAG: PAS domain S-box protein [Bacteroidia bacterium]
MKTTSATVTDELSIIKQIKNSPSYLIFFTGLNGNILTWNEAAEKITGYLEEDVFGRHFSIFYKKENAKEAYAAIKTALKQGFYENIGWRVKKNDEAFWVSETLTRLTGSNSTDGFLVIIRELTQSKETEEIAYRWQYMFERSDWPFAISAPDNDTFVLVNPAFAKMYGYSVEELTGKPITLIVDPESQSRLSENINILHKEGHHLYESRHVRKDGTSFPVIIDATAIRDNSGKVQQRLVSVRDISDLKKIQEASIINEEKFHQLFEQASDGIFVADLDGRYTNVNTAGCHMLGYTKEELLGKTIMDLLREEDIPRLNEQKEFLLKPGHSRVNEWLLRKKDGTLIPTEISAKILPNGQWQAFVRDISERKKTQEILISSEQKFRGLLEQYQDAIIIVDKHGTIEFVNNQFKSKFGYEPGEVIGMPLEELIPERFRMKHVGHRMKYMGHPIARPMGLGLDLYALRKDGTEFPVDISLVPFESDKGMVFTAFIRDLSDRKRFEAQQKFLAEISVALSENVDVEARLFSIANLCVPFLADFCLLFIDEKNKFVPKTWVHREKSLQPDLGTLASDLFSKPEISPYKAGTITENLKPLIIENVTDSFLHAVTTSEEKFKSFKDLNPVSILFVPLVAREKIIGVLILVMSSSGRKFTEEDISFITQVGYRIGLSIDNINLFHEAQQATREREDVLSIVSHDLRNPLSAIKSGAQLINSLAKDQDYETLNKLVSTLTEASNFMERLINDLLDFSKIQQGILPVKVQEVSVKKLTEDVVQFAIAKVNEKSIDLSLKIPEPDFNFICDPHRIKQVLNNLLGNAIKFTPEKGKITLIVKEQGDILQFSVADTGPGISEKDLPHLFERYWQEKKTAHLGTGLGLFIAKGIIEAHHGKIWVESKIGQGSDFHFEIPKKIKV